MNRKIQSMLEAIEQGIITPSTKEGVQALEREKEELMQVKVPRRCRPSIRTLPSYTVTRFHS
ncbi:MAG: hypothetical protein B7Y80_19470 [Hyphomicrobium sp. 32-62-53]|nr:MAG: hypothetical protein B7Y80_19470 [Hyphomicrobium sp. 32-62-53]